ncbi:MAG: hypothetical protein IPL22_04875 [Bacteroidetes bacterium]|nr:hypothetical protein [Bacteroidota bacterium]
MCGIFTFEKKNEMNYVHIELKILEANGELIVENETIIKHINVRIANEMRFDDYLGMYLGEEALIQLFGTIPIAENSKIQGGDADGPP